MPELGVLALYPPAKNGRDIAEYSFLSEEFSALARRGIRVFSVSPYARTTYRRDGVTIQAIPRSRRDASQILANLRFAFSSQFRGPRLRRWRDSYRVALIERHAAEVARREGVNVIHSCFAWPRGSAGALVKRVTGKPLLLSLRGADILTEPSLAYGARLDGFYDSLLRQALHRADRITGNSRYVLEKAWELGADRRKCVLLAKGVDVERYSPGAGTDAVRQHLEAHRRPIVLSVRHLVPKNGLEYLIHAARLVANKIPEVLVVICGKGRDPYRERLRALVQSLELQHHVRFAGLVPRDQIASYFAACDVSVIPSVMEAAGNVILEAMACARPVVGSRVGGIPEYIEDGVDGFLVQPRDPSALAEKILCLLQNRNLAEHMGQAGRRRVSKSCRFDTMLDKLEALYREVARSPSSSGESLRPCRS